MPRKVRRDDICGESLPDDPVSVAVAELLSSLSIDANQDEPAASSRTEKQTSEQEPLKRSSAVVDDSESSPAADHVADEPEKPNPFDPELVAQVTEKLQELGLSTSGSPLVLQGRLSLFQKRTPALQPVYALDYLIVIDFEATCNENKRAGSYEQEIIEFPAVLIDVRNRCVLDSFHRFCRPVKHRILSEFCTSLTGISQQEVDKADSFAVVLKEFERWLANYDLGKQNRWCVVTDGTFDISLFLSCQCKISRIAPPGYCKLFAHLPKLFQWIYLFNDPDKGRANMYAMLEHLGLQPEGRLHSGIADAHNLARICLEMIRDGVQFRPTDVAYFHEPDEKKKEFCCKILQINKKKWVPMHKNMMGKLTFSKA